jgi:hypothetical protein
VRHNAEWFFFLVNLDVFEIFLFGDRLVDLVLLAALAPLAACMPDPAFEQTPLQDCRRTFKGWRDEPVADGLMDLRLSS